MSAGMYNLDPSLYGDLPRCGQSRPAIEKTAEGWQASATFVFPAGYPGFAGHFPGKPILPAIVQLAAVRYLAECAVGRRLTPRRYVKIKFKGVIVPGEQVSVSVALAGGPDGWRGTFKLSRPAGEPVASGLAEFTGE